MKSIQTLLTSLIILFSLCSIVGQTSLSGKVTDDLGELVILGTVALYVDGNLINGIETDFDGLFYFKDIDPGIYTIEFSH